MEYANKCIHFPTISIHFRPPHPPNCIPQFLRFVYVGKMEQKPKEAETKKKTQRDRLCIASPCSAVKHIEVWLDCTGQFWSPCQTHRCIIMTDCVLESCQKPASVLLPCSPFLSPPFICIHLSGYCSLFEYVSDSVYNSTWHAFHFNKCRPCISFFSFEEMSRWGLDFHLWAYHIK